MNKRLLRLVALLVGMGLLVQGFCLSHPSALLDIFAGAFIMGAALARY